MLFFSARLCLSCIVTVLLHFKTMSLWLSGWTEQLNIFCGPHALFKAKIISNLVISFLNRAAWTTQTLSCTPAGSSPAFALYDLHSTEGLLEMESFSWVEWKESIHYIILIRAGGETLIEGHLMQMEWKCQMGEIKWICSSTLMPWH